MHRYFQRASTSADGAERRAPRANLVLAVRGDQVGGTLAIGVASAELERSDSAAAARLAPLFADLGQ